MRRRVRLTSVSILATMAMVSSLALVPVDAVAAVTRTPLWARTYAPSNIATGTAVAVNPSDTTVFVGGSTTKRPKEFVIAAYAADTGLRRWLALYPCSDVVSDSCWVNPDSMAASPDGTTVYVTGSSSPGDGTRDVVTMALDASDGSQRWIARTENASDLNGIRMSLSPTGDRIFVVAEVGSIDDPSTWGDRVVAYDASTGALVWRIRIRGIASASPESLLAVSPDGLQVFLSVTRAGKAGERVKTLALSSATGTVSWVRLFGRPGTFHKASDMVVATDGRRLFVADYRWGYVRGGEGEMIRWPVVLAYAPGDGRLLWKSVVVGALTYWEEHLGLAASTHQVFLTNGYAVGSLAARTGRVQWVRITATSSGAATEFKLAVSPDGGRVYEIDALTDDTFSRFRLETAAVDTATGALRWTAVRRGAPWGEIIAGAIGTRVYVAGTRRDHSGYRGLFVTAYQS